MKQTFRSNVLLALVLGLASATAIAQTERTIEIQTDEGQLDVPLDDGVPLRILTDGDISASAISGFSCSSGGATCDDVQVSMSSADGGSFTVTPNPVTQGSTVSIAWSGTGAWECTGSGLPGTSWETQNPKQPAGQETVGTGQLAENTNFDVEVTCSNGPVTATRTISLFVEEDAGPEPPQGCEDVPALRDYPGWSAANDILRVDTSHDPGVFADIFNQPFPGTANQVELEIRKGEYAAIGFETPSNLTSSSVGQFNSENNLQDYANGDVRIVSISECPGVFDPQYVEDPDCIDSELMTESFRWVGPNHPESNFRCNLQPNKTYYLNIVFSQSPVGDFPPTQATCEPSETHCGSLLQHLSSLQ